MTNVTYKEKLKIISELFSVPLYTKNNDYIDFSGYDTTNNVRNILNKSHKPTPEDFKYINFVVSKLISILLLDESKITKEYISHKLITLLDSNDPTSGKVPFCPDKIWVENYKNLIKFIKNDRYNL